MDGRRHGQRPPHFDIPLFCRIVGRDGLAPPGAGESFTSAGFGNLFRDVRCSNPRRRADWPSCALRPLARLMRGQTRRRCSLVTWCPCCKHEVCERSPQATRPCGSAEGWWDSLPPGTSGTHANCPVSQPIEGDKPKRTNGFEYNRGTVGTSAVGTGWSLSVITPSCFQHGVGLRASAHTGLFPVQSCRALYVARARPPRVH